MYCHDCENYFGEASCRVKGLTGYLRKADELPCFKPKQPKNENNMSKKTNTTEGIPARTCKVCGCIYPVTKFDPDSRSKDGLSHICRDCADKRAIERVRKLKATLKKRQTEACAELGIKLPGGANDTQPGLSKEEYEEEMRKAAEEAKRLARGENITDEARHLYSDLLPEPKPKPKPDPKNDYPREDMANDLVALLRIYGYHGTLTKTYEDCEITITIR